MQLRRDALIGLVVWGLTAIVFAQWNRVELRGSVVRGNTRLVLEGVKSGGARIEQSPQRIEIHLQNCPAIGDLQGITLSATPIVALNRWNWRGTAVLELQLSQPVKLRHTYLAKPDRLVLDLQVLKAAETSKARPDLEARGVPQLSKSSTGPLRIDEQSKSVDNNPGSLGSTKIATVQATQQQSLPSNVADDIDRAEQQLLALISQDFPAVDKNPEPPVFRNRGIYSREIVVVIDPGHGGKDPGAIGISGTREKEVTLAIAWELQREISKMKGFRAIMTRTGDYFVPLRQRLGIARRHHADMFISIHADAYKSPTAYGASVFALSQRGATSEAARWLAEKENESELGQAIAAKSALLRSVLLDLAQTATISASLDLGKQLLQNLAKITHLHSARVEQAAFVVLKAPDLPSLLVEVGFISYQTEERRLCQRSYQQKLARQLAEGIGRYFSAHPLLPSPRL